MVPWIIQHIHYKSSQIAHQFGEINFCSKARNDKLHNVQSLTGDPGWWVDVQPHLNPRMSNDKMSNPRMSKSVINWVLANRMFLFNIACCQQVPLTSTTYQNLSNCRYSGNHAPIGIHKLNTPICTNSHLMWGRHTWLKVMPSVLLHQWRLNQETSVAYAVFLYDETGLFTEQFMAWTSYLSNGHEFVRWYILIWYLAK